MIYRRTYVFNNWINSNNGHLTFSLRLYCFLLISKDEFYFFFNKARQLLYCIKKVVLLLQGGPKKSLWCDLEERCLRNSKIFFDGVFLSIYSHLLKKSELSKLRRKKLWVSKNPEKGLFKKSQPIKKDTYFFILFLVLYKN